MSVNEPSRRCQDLGCDMPAEYYIGSGFARPHGAVYRAVCWQHIDWAVDEYVDAWGPRRYAEVIRIANLNSFPSGSDAAATATEPISHPLPSQEEGN